MGDRKSEKEYEDSRLRQTLQIAKEQLQQAKENAESTKAKIVETKREAYENATHGVLNLNDPEEFENIAEFSQYSNAVNNSIAAYEEEEHKIRLLETMMRSPYFARIDFRFDDEEEAEEIYIGRSSLKKESCQEIVVYDWRSPIAGVFYRFMKGAAYYEAPCGRITGEVSLKRQYEIKNGILEYFFDTDVQIVDEFLRQMLSQNTTSKMKAIVETIQKEQDVAIRDMENDLLMVQGVAGSGKTSIALHRAAYLMYQGLQTRLSAEHIMIISPNAVFEQYISDVLPELGEDRVVSVVFEDLLHSIIKEKTIQPRNEFLEQLMARSRFRKVRKNSIGFKTSKRFMELLDLFLQDIPQRWIPFEDVIYEGKVVVSGDTLRERVTGRAETLLGTKLEQLEPYVVELIFGTGTGRGAEKNLVRQGIRESLKLDVVELYRRLFQDEAYFCRLLNGGEPMQNELPEEIKEIWEYTKDNLEADRLYYDDAIAVAYLYLKIYGADAYRNIRHVVIDEAQDYYPLQYEIFGLLFPYAKFTILGDMNQTIEKHEDLSLYGQIRNIFNRKKSSLVVLDQSFRCTNEILNFSLRFIEHSPQIKSFNRNGDSPEAVAADHFKALISQIAQEVKLCQERGFRSIGLICKHKENAVRLWKAMEPEMDVPLISDGGVSELSGAFIIPVYMAKGLEYDAVLICDADSRNYVDEDDKNLLYVACTRALHRLSLFGEKELSPLI